MDSRILKGFGIFLILFVLIVGGMVFFDNLNKVEVLKEDHISDVTFDENKKNIYIFWGNGCTHCEHLKEYLTENAKSWKDDYQIFAFETWKDEENEKLMNDVLALMDKENEGTPTVIIGDEVIVGYGEDMNSTFEAAFQSEKDNEYDVIKKYQEQ